MSPRLVVALCVSINTSITPTNAPPVQCKREAYKAMAKPKRARRPAPATLRLLAAPVKVAIGEPVAEVALAEPVAVPTGATAVPLTDGYGTADGATTGALVDE